MEIETCQIHGQVTVLNEKPPDGKTWSGVRLTRKQTTSRPDTLWPEIWKDMSDGSKRKEKQKWLARNQSSTMPEDCVVFTSLEFKDIIKNARGKLEITMPAAMPCNTPMCQSSRETCRNIGKHKTKYVCIVEADESMRKRMEESLPKYHENHIAGKRGQFTTTLRFGTQIYSYASSYENSRSKGSGGQGMGKIGENFGVESDESQKQERGDQ